MPPDGPVLAFDTSAGHCAVAILGPAVHHVHVETMRRGQAERLLPLIEQALDKARIEMSQIARIGVGVGPGNFTGIRIAVAAARGLAMGLNCPAIGVSSLEALAHGAKLPITLRIPAMGDTHYAQTFERAGSGPLCLEPGAATPVAPERLIRGIVEIAATRTPNAPPTPLYIRPADAAPPRDAAPILLP